MFVESGSFCVCLRRVALTFIVLVYLPRTCLGGNAECLRERVHLLRTCSRRSTRRNQATP